LELQVEGKQAGQKKSSRSDSSGKFETCSDQEGKQGGTERKVMVARARGEKRIGARLVQGKGPQHNGKEKEMFHWP